MQGQAYTLAGGANGEGAGDEQNASRLEQESRGADYKALSEIAKINEAQVVHLLVGSDYSNKGTATQVGSVNLPPTLWKLKHHVPGSAKDEDLKRRIAETSG